jgi:hypothetical protein
MGECWTKLPEFAHEIWVTVMFKNVPVRFAIQLREHDFNLVKIKAVKIKPVVAGAGIKLFG